MCGDNPPTVCPGLFLIIQLFKTVLGYYKLSLHMVKSAKKAKQSRVLSRDVVGSIAMSWYTVNVWWMECTVKSSVKNTVKSTAESFKPGILKNEKIDNP